VQLVLSILGLTWERIKARIFAKVPGLAAVWDKLVGAFEVVRILLSEGVGGLWRWVVEKVGDIKEMVMSQIKEMVATQIIKAGITWLISMLNPAGAFIKACKMIYDVVMFFVEKAAQIKEFVEAVLDSVESIAAGGVGAVAAKIEDALGKLVPILIGFLASLLGVGGIADKVKKILEMVQKPVMAVVDWVVDRAVGIGKRLLGGLKRIGGKVKAGAKKLTAKVKAKLGIKEKTPEQIAKDKQDRLDKGVAAGVAAANRFAGKPVAGKVLTPLLTAIRLRYRMKSLTLVAEGGHWAVAGEVNPVTQKPTRAKPPDPDVVEALTHVGKPVTIVDAAGQRSQGTVDEVDAEQKRVRIASRAPSVREGHRIFVGAVNVGYAALSDFLSAVRGGKPVQVGGAAELKHPSRFVVNVNGKMVLSPAAKATWRRTFYGDYSPARKAWKVDMLRRPFTGDPKNGIAHPADLSLHVTNRRFWCRNNYYDPKSGKRFQPTIDHDPPVVQDWNDSGRLSVQAPRKAFFSAGDLEILPWWLNSSEGSGGITLVDEVGPDFRGPGEKS
jgi:hypothetical protein